MGCDGRRGHERRIIASSAHPSGGPRRLNPDRLTDEPPADRTDRPPRTAVVPDSAAGRRFDAVLAELFPEFSRSRLAEWIKSGDALLDGKCVRGRDPVRGGETVTLDVALETQTACGPEDIPLDVLYEDERRLRAQQAGRAWSCIPARATRPAPWSTRCCIAIRRCTCCRAPASCIASTRTPPA